MKKFAEGGFSAAQEEWLGGADRTDPIILARMRAAVPDAKPASRDFDTTDSETTSMDLPALKGPKSVERTVVKTKVEPAKSSSKEFKPLGDKDEEGNKLPTDVKKPYVSIPKNAAGMQQFRSDAVSPMERLFKSITGKSQRTTAAEKKMAKGGSVKASSASKRGDGCAVRGKTKGRMV